MTSRNSTVAEDNAEQQARTRWKTDQALRSEFLNDLDFCVAFFKAEARGDARRSGRPVVALKAASFPANPSPSPTQRAGTAQLYGSPPQHYPARLDAVDAGARLSHLQAWTPEEDALIEREWKHSAALRVEFCDDFAICLAYFKAEALGRMKIFGQSAQGRRDVAAPAAPVAAPADSSTAVSVSPSGRYVALGNGRRVVFESWRERWVGNWERLPGLKKQYNDLEAYALAMAGHQLIVER